MQTLQSGWDTVMIETRGHNVYDAYIAFFNNLN